MSQTTMELLRTGPFHEALRAAVQDSGLTLEGLQRRIHRRGVRVSLTALSYWRQGRSRPERPDSLRALRAIEEILRLPDGSLPALLGPPRPRGRWARRAGRGDVGPGGFATAPPGPGAPVACDTALRAFCQLDSVRVGADRSIRRVGTRMVLRALDDGPEQCTVVYSGEPGVPPSAIRPEAVEGCTVGRVRRHPHDPLVAAELLFDRALHAGQTHLIEYAFTITDPTASRDFRRAFRYPAQTYVLDVRFDPGALPSRCFRFSQSNPASPEVVEGELDPAPCGSVHIAEHGMGGGVLGIGWD
ncbi:helix-turn-helix domain-containing protein [Nocardiopsis suaedae]|uniref:XRE family transcriptional regulator n=1 Tax=Nocardiopsis suaedae TaxID=3018444 RepID=A0ABT4TGW1_9ACTN|nr:hypothetical protein [Nocardiopsis suaedae]MDA2803949.1 hypothetical protein [Nocardiopsis suaedae]